MPRRFPLALTCQVALVACVIVGAALWPPERGALLLVPLSGRIIGPVDVAMSSGAALVTSGPLPGSLVVLGERRAVSAMARDHGILIFSAPSALCGATTLAAKVS